jgi:hypothetical protein
MELDSKLYYDKNERKLYRHDENGREDVIKKVASRAKDIHRILCCFEEEGWPEFIFDPTPPNAEAEISHDRRVSSMLNKWNSSTKLNPTRVVFRTSDGTQKIHADLLEV